MPHNIPSVPFFRDSPLTDKIQEFALRVVVELPDWEFHVIGTATLIGAHLAVTAKHVLDYAAGRFGGKRTQRGIEVDGYSLRLVQVLPGPIYRIWNVFSAWITSSDIAILHLGLDRASGEETKKSWRSPLIRLVPPPTDKKYSRSAIANQKLQ